MKKKLAEGKTKIIWETENPDEVEIESKDDLTAGDGAKHILLPDKGAFATETTCNCFQLLEKSGIKTHFVRRTGPASFRAKKMEMFPWEVVTRRIATGSYLKRNPDTREGHKFEDLKFEIFLKDDSRHDPLMIFDFVGNRILLYDAKKPLKEGFLDETPIHSFDLCNEAVLMMLNTSRDVFGLLEKAWQRLNVSLVDLKIEFGLCEEAEFNFVIKIADVIDNDSWRIWPEGKKELMRDKQVFRDSEETDEEKLKQLRQNYEWVAQQTKKFLE